MKSLYASDKPKTQDLMALISCPQAAEHEKQTGFCSGNELRNATENHYLWTLLTASDQKTQVKIWPHKEETIYMYDKEITLPSLGPLHMPG